MVRAMAVVTFGVLLVGYGVAEGLWSGRWGQSDEVRQAVARLDAVPRTIGDWQGEDSPHDPRQLEVAEIQGYVSRVYTNRRTRARVSVLLVCGRPGPIAVHPPNICFTAQGFDMAAAPDRFTV